MAKGLAELDPSYLATLSAGEAVALFQKMLWCAARQIGIPVTSITISSNIDAADGGIDAEILQNTVSATEDLLVAGNSFFQIKTGASAKPWQPKWMTQELFGKRKKPGRASLGKAVRHCLDVKGRYVIVCFGGDPTGVQRRKAKSNLLKCFKACGYKAPNVDVWGQSTLVGLTAPFPSIRLEVSERNHLPFLTLAEWRRDAQMDKPFHPGSAQVETIRQIHELLRGDRVHHIRLVGEPGLGKSKLVLEALSAADLAPAVVYVRYPDDFERSPLYKTIPRSDDRTSMILVIDDCPERERASIWNVLRTRSDRIRLVTLDHGPETSSDERMQVLQCPALGRDEIKEILAGYLKSTSAATRWVEFCSGSPRVAHAVGENLVRNPDDILKSPADVPIWERFILGNSKVHSADAQQKEVVLRHLALFQKFGFEKPVQEEARFIAGLVSEADPAITWHKFQSIIRHFRDRRILQGKSTLFLVPRLLHIHLWTQFWESYGSGTNLAELLSRMPASLFRWFADMFKYGHASSACLRQIELLTSHGGPFDDEAFLRDGPGAMLLNDVAEAHPEAALRCIERTIGSQPRESLSNFGEHRHYIVCALAARGESPLTLVDSAPGDLSRRLKIHLINVFSDQDPALARTTMMDRSLFNDSRVKHEYARLMGSRFLMLSAVEQEAWFKWLEEGPNMERFERRHENLTEQKPSQEERQQFHDYWQFERLHWVREHLSGARREFYEQMFEKHGEPALADLSFKMGGGWSGYRSPVHVDELEKMGFVRALELVSDWEPEDTSPFGADRDGLMNAFGALIGRDPQTCSKQAKLLVGRPADVIVAFIGQMDAALRNKTEIDVDAVLHLCGWISKHIPPVEELKYGQDNHGQWARDAAAGIIKSLCAARTGDKPTYRLELRRAMWDALEPLIDSPARSYVVWDQDGGDVRTQEFLSLSLNSPRGKALHAVFEYARWIAVHSAVQQDDRQIVLGGFEIMPEMRQLLERQLEANRSSFEARGVFGENVALLYWIDPEWLRANADRIFDIAPSPEVDLTTQHGWAAWNSFLVSTRPHIEYFNVLSKQFKLAIEVAIVPDGVLFGSSNAHQALRQELVEEQKLDAIISMPSGVFKPYAGVSTASVWRCSFSRAA